MSQITIIHTGTRVVRRLTSDISPPLAADESSVDTSAAPINLDPAGSGTGYWKLDTSTPPLRVAASASDVTSAGVDPAQLAATALANRTAYKAAIASSQALIFGISISVGSMVTLTNVGAAYDATTASKGLGIALVDFSQALGMRIDIFVSKIGTGTQSWQVWNDTDGAEITHLDDAGVAADRVLTQTFTAAQVAALGLAGVKRIRIRAKSTVAADDPVFYGAAIGVNINPFADFFQKLSSVVA